MAPFDPVRRVHMDLCARASRLSRGWHRVCALVSPFALRTTCTPYMIDVCRCSRCRAGRDQAIVFDGVLIVILGTIVSWLYLDRRPGEIPLRERYPGAPNRHAPRQETAPRFRPRLGPSWLGLTAGRRGFRRG